MDFQTIAIVAAAISVTVLIVLVVLRDRALRAEQYERDLTEMKRTDEIAQLRAQVAHFQSRATNG